jgi:RNA polymerase sigma factor (sigma-70 family)
LHGGASETTPIAGEAVERGVEAIPHDAVSRAELEDARDGFLHSLSRRFGRDFKERHGDDLFAQALYEFSRKLDQGEEIRNPAGWIFHCSWNRARSEMEARDWRPQLVSIDFLLIELVAERSWQPEDSFLSDDRVRLVREAVEQLPGHQREIVIRHYFEGESVREVSRKLGWSEAKGARAHMAARKKLKEIFAEVEFVGTMS